ncbi:MAG: Flp pilus assembly protein CpaB [Gemmatimonadales bacterium]|nr:Flp pilus assembly protein CpaB [Gemmatimonadales bacterium]
MLLLLLALLSGGVAAVVALRYLRQQASPLMAAERPNAQIVVAARPMALGSVVGERDVKLVEWSGGAMPGGFIGTLQEVVGRGLIVPVEENEPVLAGKLAAQGAGGGLPVIIDQGMRAFSIAVDQVIGVSGFVGPNTRVDVLLSLVQSPTLREPTTKVIMQNLKILAAGASIQQDKEGKPLEVPVVTLLVTPEQAETLGLATGQGRIQLALRHTLDTLNVRTTGAPVSSLMGTPRRAPGRKTVARSAEPEPTSTTVEVYRGGQRTLQKFGP